MVHMKPGGVIWGSWGSFCGGISGFEFLKISLQLKNGWVGPEVTFHEGGKVGRIDATPIIFFLIIKFFEIFGGNFDGSGITPSHFLALMKWPLLVLTLISWHRRGVEILLYPLCTMCFWSQNYSLWDSWDFSCGPWLLSSQPYYKNLYFCLDCRFKGWRLV